ncbi:hypothetical protein SLS62_011323 [Diatrype stigma]|uniref:Uncharacterized protein n=1 Tax=Diatrype stigma TaxID=117547 RepID=A0AAN9UCM1_9PEZI
MDMKDSSKKHDESASSAGGTSSLEVSVLNTGIQPIVAPTRGLRRILVPWDPFQPEEADDSRARIIDDSASPAPTSSLQILDVSTGDVVGEVREPEPRGGLTDSNDDRRPKLQNLVTLMPGEPLTRSSWISAGYYVDC